jgi:hypothetical protein
VALFIRSEQVDNLARQLAQATGESITQAVGTALQERLQRVRPHELSPATLERNRAAVDLLRQAREANLEQGTVAPTKREIEEMLDFDEY